MSLINVAPLRSWKPLWGMYPYVYIFRNLPDIIPGRWGFGFKGLIEIGSRNPGNTHRDSPRGDCGPLLVQGSARTRLGVLPRPWILPAHDGSPSPRLESRRGGGN